MNPSPVDGISVVVPVYNSEQTLETLVRRVSEVAGSIASRHEIILVNDGSADGSWLRIGSLAAEHPHIRGIDLMRNSGQHNALLAGIRAARYDVTVTLDDDLQNPPEEMPKLVDKLGEGWDVVYGSPERRQFAPWRNLGARISQIALSTAMGASTARQVSAYRAFRTPLRQAFARFDGPHVSIDVLLTWGTTRFTSVQVAHDARTVGRSNYSFLSLVRHGMNMMTGFSTRPLQFASVVGFGLAFVGLILFAYVITRRLVSGISVPGFAFLASLVAVFSGAQLFALGIIGEYLGRLHFRTMRKPTYVVRDQVAPSNGDDPEDGTPPVP